MKYELKLNGRTYEVEVELAEPMQMSEFMAYAPAPAAPAGASGKTAVKAPFPGTVLKVNVSAGASVKKGDVLVVLEAMKMENDICAPEDGVVASVSTQNGAAVSAEDVLVTLG